MRTCEWCGEPITLALGRDAWRTEDGDARCGDGGHSPSRKPPASLTNFLARRFPAPPGANQGERE